MKREWWDLPDELEELLATGPLERRSYTPSEMKKFLEDLGYNYTASKIRKIASERGKRGYYTFIFFKCPPTFLNCPLRESVSIQQCLSTRNISPKPGCVILREGWEAKVIE